MPSASPLTRAAALAACLVLIGAGAAGCETTQEKAAKQQAQSERILEAREERRQEKKREKAKKHDKGEKKK